MVLAFWDGLEEGVHGSLTHLGHFATPALQTNGSTASQSPTAKEKFEDLNLKGGEASLAPRGEENPSASSAFSL